MKPMLASKISDDVQFPVYASAKLDGIRALIYRGRPVSRKLKTIPNYFVTDYLSNRLFEGLDGELTVGSWNARNLMQETTSGVMSYYGEPDFNYWIFDNWSIPNSRYEKRLQVITERLNDRDIKKFSRVKLLPQILINNWESLYRFESECVSDGFEGVMIRSMDSPYKYGRSTTREGYLLKVKRWSDSEGVIIGIKELMHNANRATINALGNTERSSHRANQVPMDTLGALVLQDIHTGESVSVGTGFTQDQRSSLWKRRKSLRGKIVKYKHFEIGSKDAPRFPTFLGFRHKDDIDLE
jgi:DNA ligase-1